MTALLDAFSPSFSPTYDISGWTCNWGFYGSGDGCDCNCGIPDPDCTPESTKFFNCRDYEICVDAVCVSIVPTESPTAAPFTPYPTNSPTIDLSDWTCNVDYYGADDGCDCNCGKHDPDCTPGNTEIYNCEHKEICLDGLCASGAPTKSPTAAPSSSPTDETSKWTCNIATYGTDDGCDCNCGMPDPDCTPESTKFFNCRDYEICVDAVCVSIVPTESPTAAPTGLNPTSDPTSYPTVDLSEWTCNIYFYGDDICDCNCGLPDPDCTPETTESINCDYNEVCLDGVCVSIVPTESPSPAPSSSPTDEISKWTCNIATYGTDDGCDCNCGLPDPDCTPESTKFFNCRDYEICVDAVCVSIVPTESPTAAPLTPQPTISPTIDLSDWTCNVTYYGADDGCDCNCGMHDPDCTPGNTEIYNCEDKEICLDGVCASVAPTNSPSNDPLNSPTVATSEWTCNIGNYGTDDGCHCNCGLHDPDCDRPDPRIINCETGQACANGLCSTLFPTSAQTSPQSVTSSPTTTQITSPPVKSDHEGLRDWIDRESTAGILVIGLTIMIILGVVVRYKKTNNSSPNPGDGNNEVAAREQNGGPCSPESTKGINHVAHYSLKQEA